MPGTMVFIENSMAGFDGYFADSGDRIAGIDAKIGKKLINLRGIDLRLPETGLRLPDQIDILPKESPQHLQHVFNGLVEIQDLGGDCLFTGKGQ